MTTWEPDPSLSLGRIMKADGAVREVVKLIRPLIRLGSIDIPGCAALPNPCSRTEPFKPTSAVLDGNPVRPREVAPLGGPTLIKVNTLRGVNDVLNVAVLGLEEVNSLPFVQRKSNRSMRPNAHDEVRPEEPPDRPPEPPVHLSPRRRTLGRVGPLRERTPVSAVEDTGHRSATWPSVPTTSRPPPGPSSSQRLELKQRDAQARPTPHNPRGLAGSDRLEPKWLRTHTHTHTCIYTYIYIYA